VYWPYLAVVVVLGAMLLFSMRNRRRQLAAQQELAGKIGFGSEVMTTSGLYGTVVARNDDQETVQLSIAPGVEVKWALAALRPVESVPARYRKGFDAPGGSGEPLATEAESERRDSTSDGV
jgi:preprotein translocase subunit YajC